MRYRLFLVVGLILVLVSLGFVNAWEFNGTVRDINGNYLNNSLINITIWTMGQTGPSLVGANSTTSNESGWFNLSVSENSSWMYKPVITHTNSTTNAIDYIGQSLPEFPYREFANTSDINFYLRPAGTINITAINESGARISFQYQVKDTKLGYPIAESFTNYVQEAIVYVPRDRNYSIMIYPNESLPVSFDWNNFTASSSYNIVTGLSTYNVTTHTVQKTFNTTINFIRITGYIQNSTGDDFADWNEFRVIPYILEPGNMIYMGSDAAMPYNMSAWNHNTCGFTTITNETGAWINSTGYQLTSGKYNYNITAIWANDSGEYNISVTLGNATVSETGLVTNATATTWENVSISYTYYEACSDEYNLTSGFYNITVPGPAESVTYILFATARNGSNYYGGYRNISLSYSDSSTELNFTMYPLMSTDWGSANSNISMNDATDWSPINISTAKQQFNIVNSSNVTISNTNFHLEVKVDYSDYGAREFTFMTDISSGNATIYLPLLNASVKEINVFSQSYAPKRVSTKTTIQILTNPNITMTTFNPGDIDGEVLPANIQVALYKSNSSCDVPNPDSSCVIADSATMDPNADDAFNPLSAVIGGGKLSFRMGLLSSGIIVEYVDVDMLASGPPDALFDDSATTSTSGTFSSAMRFGSNGPTIYDHVLISIPYTEGSSSQTGLNENADVNMSIPVLYDEDWNVIWNASLNGTNGTALAGNYSHYSTHSSDWNTLMNQNNCTRNQSEFNSTNPCYIDTSNNRIWIRLPHFSGTQPSIVGNVITATSSSTTSTDGGGTASFWKRTYVVTDEQFIEGYTKELAKKHRFKIPIGGENHYVGVVELTDTTATINVSSTPQQATLAIGDIRRFDVTEDGYYDLNVKLNSIENNKANLTIKSIHEKVTVETEAEEAEKEEKAKGEAETTPIEKKNLTWLWIVIGIIVLILVGIGYGAKRRR